MGQGYRTLRNMGKDLTTKIFSTLNKDEFTASAKALGWVERGAIVFPSMTGVDILTDYCLYEFRVQDKNTLERFHASHLIIDEDEKVLLNAMINSQNSFFEVVGSDEKMGEVQVIDLLQDNNPKVLTDFGMSRSLLKGSLIYIRVITLPDFSMTSGVSFPFSPQFRKQLLTGYDLEKFKKRGKMSSRDKFMFFLKKWEDYGIMVINE